MVRSFPLLLLLVACETEPSSLFAYADLPGVPSGLASDDDGTLVVVHANGTGGYGLTGLSRGSLVEVFSHGGGPGKPMMSDGRTYVGRQDALAAVQGATELWEVVLDGDYEAPGPSCVTPGGLVVTASWNGMGTTLTGVSRLGEVEWSVGVTSHVRGNLRVGADGTVYFQGENAGGTLLYAMDSANGGILWSEPGPAEPLAVLSDGLLVSHDGLLAKRIPSGLIEWESSAEVGPHGVTLTHDGDAWVPGPTTLSRVALNTGTVLQSIARSCGPLSYGADNRMWGLCDNDAGQYAFSAIGPVVEPLSTPLPTVPVSAPVLLQGTAYVAVGGDVPRVLGFTGSPLPSTLSPWSTAAGVGNTGRPD